MGRSQGWIILFKSFENMAQISNISQQVQLKSSGDKFYDFFINKMDHFVHMFPQNLKSYKIVEGNGFAHGSVVHWKYDLGSPAEAKVRLAVDEANKSITFECLEGDILEEFEVFQVKFEVKDSGRDGINSVKWCVVFVKANEDVLPPHDHLQFGLKMCKGLDAHLSKN